MSRRWFRMVGLVSSFVVVSAVAHAALSKLTDARVSFRAIGPAGLKIDGQTGAMTVREDAANVVLTLPVATFTTGIALRDRHMRDHLETEKYPDATLTLARSALRFPPSGERVELDVVGTLVLHGETHPVTVHYEATGVGGPLLLVNGRFHVRMGDFGIKTPSYLGVNVKPDVDVSATFRVSTS